ncbi:hypothetical protein TL16_g00264 [Triparma laevis f. inornata]|uniref:Sulfotransferase domain-containing protein n=1 Tax=Triparma laevis f. inornata TaxID=1714386 RepID=A0A9W6ZBX6_9STRA|nr:hypothetical protein TL16_g00264 [Triparma laevis f. inornata]
MPFELTQSDSDCVAKMKERLSGFETEEGRLSGLNYTPKIPNTEVIITTSPKAGTTWLQQICHQLRSPSPSGDMSFDEISSVVPWLELAHDQGQDLNQPQLNEEVTDLRIWKSHAWEPDCPKGAKYIVVARDPCDVAISFYKFFENWFFEKDEISVDAFVQEFWLMRGVPESKMQNASYFHHLLSWWRRRNDDDVLFLFFENLKSDLEKEVTKIAAFISNSKWSCTSSSSISLATSMSSFEFMSSHSSHFNESLSKKARNVACGLREDAGMGDSKIKSGESGGGKKKLSEQLKGMIGEKWKEVMEEETGHATYELLRDNF